MDGVKSEIWPKDTSLLCLRLQVLIGMCVITVITQGNSTEVKRRKTLDCRIPTSREGEASRETQNGQPDLREETQIRYDQETKGKYVNKSEFCLEAK